MTSDDRAGRWHRDLYAAAVWSSDLTTTQRIVALAYADHARDADTAWVSYERLMHRTGLGRTALAGALGRLVIAGWLVVVDPARQRRSAVYRLTIPQQFAFRTPDGAQQFASRTPDGPSSSPRGTSSSPRGTSSSPAEPHCSSDLTTDNTTTAREEVDVIVNSEDREPRSDESLADRVRGAGVAWSDVEINDALRRLTRAFGDDAAAMTPAVAVLMSLATRRKPIDRVGAYLASLNDEQVRALRPAARPQRPAHTPAPRPTWCGDCYEPTRRREDPDSGRDLGRCPRCHPDLARKAA